jgi:hypothetical protein
VTLPPLVFPGPTLAMKEKSEFIGKVRMLNSYKNLIKYYLPNPERFVKSTGAMLRSFSQLASPVRGSQ